MRNRSFHGAVRNVPPGSCFISGLGAEDDQRIATAALIHSLRALGLQVAAMTPMVSDAILQAGRWTSKHLDALGSEGSFELPGPALSPYVLPSAPTPAMAAELAGLHINGKAVVETYEVLATWADVVVVEGVGGLSVRLGPSLAVHDIVRRLALPLVLAIRPDASAPQRAVCAKGFASKIGVRIAGWIATDADHSFDCSLSALTAVMGTSPFAELPSDAVPGWPAVKHVNLSKLRGALAID